MKYAVNLVQSIVSLFGNKVLIPVGSYKPISDREVDHGDVAHAVRVGWIEIADEEPVGMEAKKIEIEFTTPSVQGSPYPPGKEPKEEVATEDAPAEDATATTKKKRGSK